MNLFLRLLRVFIHAFYRSKLGLFDTSVLNFWVGPFDLDINRHMTNSRYLSVMDLGRTDLLIRSELREQIWKKKWAAVLGASTIRWRRSLRLFQKFSLHTTVVGWDEKWVYIDQKIIARGEVVCHGFVKGVFVSKKGPIPMADVLKHTSFENMTSPSLPESIIHWKASELKMSEEAKMHTHKACKP